MNDLLKFTMEAHGGLDRWKRFEHISSHLFCGGVIWGIKKQAGILDDVHVTCDTERSFTSHSPFLKMPIATMK